MRTVDGILQISVSKLEYFFAAFRKYVVSYLYVSKKLNVLYFITFISCRCTLLYF